MDEPKPQVKGEPITLPESKGGMNWSNDIEAAVKLAQMTSPLMVMMLIAKDAGDNLRQKT